MGDRVEQFVAERGLTVEVLQCRENGDDLIAAVGVELDVEHGRAGEAKLWFEGDAHRWASRRNPGWEPGNRQFPGDSYARQPRSSGGIPAKLRGKSRANRVFATRTSYTVSGNQITTTAANAGVGIIDVENVLSATVSNNTITISGPNSGVSALVLGGSTLGTVHVTANTFSDPVVASSSGLTVLGNVPSTVVIDAENNFNNGFSTGVNVLSGVPAGATLTVHNNDLSGNGKTVVNGSASVTVNAAGNWMGSNSFSTVASGISGLVDDSPFLYTATNSGTALTGFEGDFSKLGVVAVSPQAVGTLGNIQEGVDDVTSGGTVYLDPAAFTEGTVSIARAMTVIGAGASQTVVTPGATSNGWTISASNVTLNNIQLNGMDTGLTASNANGLTLTNVSVTNSTVGDNIDLLDVTGATLTNVSATGSVNGDGLALRDSTGVDAQGRFVLEQPDRQRDQRYERQR